MKKTVLLEITGKQKVDGDSDKIELTTVGTMDCDEEYITFCYTEMQEPPEQPVKAQVKIKKDMSFVESTRDGAFNSCLIIEKSKRNHCTYGTQFGDMLMGIYGKSIEFEQSKNGGRYSFCYDLDINGAVTSKNEVIINYKDNNLGEQECQKL